MALHSNLSARTEVRLVSSVVTSGIQGCWLRLPGHSCFERESASPAPPDWLRSVACIQRMQYSSYMYSCSSPRSFPQTLCECCMSTWHSVTDINREQQWNILQADGGGHLYSDPLLTSPPYRMCEFIVSHQEFILYDFTLACLPTNHTMNSGSRACIHSSCKIHLGNNEFTHPVRFCDESVDRCPDKHAILATSNTYLVSYILLRPPSVNQSVHHCSCV